MVRKVLSMWQRLTPQNRLVRLLETSQTRLQNLADLLPARRAAGNFNAVLFILGALGCSLDSCISPCRTFGSETALESHSKAKHSVGK